MSDVANSLFEEDQTLPVDFDGSCNPSNLPEVTFGHNLEPPDGTQHVVTMPTGGRISPARSRTMKEYDQEIAQLKKENFNLKLRIYYLEERVNGQFDGDGEALFKTNIELKVEVDTLKKDLFEKQHLLKQASAALGSVTTQHEVELQEARDQAHQVALREAGQKREDLELQLANFQEEILQHEQVMAEQKLELEEANQRIRDLSHAKGHLEAELKVSRSRRRELETELDEGLMEDGDTGRIDKKRASDDLEDKDRLILQLRGLMKTKELIIEQLEEEKKEEVKAARGALMADLRHLEAELQDLRAQKLLSGDADKSTTESEGQMEDMEKNLHNKINMVGKLEDIIHERDDEIKNINKKLQDLVQLNKTHETNALKRDKAIQGLAKLLQERDVQVNSLSVDIEDKEDEIGKLKEDVHQLNMNKYQGAENYQTELINKAEHITDLEAALRENQLEKKRLENTISRREAEIKRLTSQLDAADQTLQQKENSLQDVREALRQEKQKQSSLADSLDKHYQTIMDDQQRRIDSQEKMLLRLTKSVQDKDQQLQDMLQAQGAVGEKNSKDTLIDRLKAQLTEKDRILEEYVSDQYKSLEEKDADIRGLKMALRDRDQDIKKANQMLVVTEEAIDSLEKESKEKSAAMKQLTSSLKAQEKDLESHNQEEWASLNTDLQSLRTELDQKKNQLQALAQVRSREHDSPSRGSPGYSKPGTNKTTDLQTLQDEVASLSNQLRNRDALINQLKAEADQRPSGTLSRENNDLQLNPANQRPTGLSLGGEKHVRDFADRCDVPQRNQTLGGDSHSQVYGDEEAQLTNLQNMSDRLHTQHQIYLSIHNPGPTATQPTSVPTPAAVPASTAAQSTVAPASGSKSISDNAHSEDGQRSLQLQLAAVQALTNQLQDGVARNQSIRASLLQQLDTSGTSQNDYNASSRLHQQVALLQAQLEESRRQNHSLEERLREQEPTTEHCDKVDGRSVDQTAKSKVPIGAKSKKRANQELSRSGRGRFDSSFNPSGLSSVEHSYDESILPRDSYLPSFRDLPDFDDGDEDSLAELKSEDLRQLVRSLRDQLDKASTSGVHNQQEGAPNHRQDQTLSSSGDVVAHLQQQLSQAHTELDKREEQIRVMRANMRMSGGATSPAEQLEPYANALQKQVIKLSAQLQHTENINSVMKRQLDLINKGGDLGVTSDLIMEMAEEIQRLKAQVDVAVSDPGRLGGVDGKKSQIPRLVQSSRTPSGDCEKNLEGQLSSLQAELIEAKKQIVSLRATLASTEATVRGQAERMKLYRGQLEEAGVFVKSPSRSRSESNLAAAANKSPARAGGLLAGDGQTVPGIDLQKLRNYGNSTDVSELQGQIKDLQSSVVQYDSAVSALKSRGRSRSAGSESGGVDGSRRAGPSHIPVLTTRLRTISASSTSSTGATAISGTAAPSSAAAQHLQSLQQEVDDLRNQLVASEGTNTALSVKLDDMRSRAAERLAAEGEPNGEVVKSVPPVAKDHLSMSQQLHNIEQSHQAETLSLRNQLAESRAICESLRNNLAELATYMEQFVEQRPPGASLDDTMPAHVKDLMSETIDMVSDLSILVQDGESQTPGPTPTAGSANYPVLHEKYEQAQQEVTHLKKQLELFSRQQDRGPNQEQLQRLRRDNETLRTALTKSEHDNSELLAKLEQLQDELFQEREQKFNSSQDKKSVIKQLSEAKNLVQTLQNHVTDSRKHSQSLQNELGDAEKLKHTIQKELADSKNSTQSLQASLTDARKQLQSAQAQLSDSRGNVKTLQSELSKSKTATEKLKSQFSDAKRHGELLEGQVSATSKHAEEFQNQLLAANKWCESLKIQLSVANQAHEGAEARLSKSEKRCDSVETQLSAANKRCEDMKAVDSGRAEIKGSDSKELSRTIEALKADREDLLRQVDMGKDKVLTLQQQVLRLTDKVKVSEQESTLLREAEGLHKRESPEQLPVRDVSRLQKPAGRSHLVDVLDSTGTSTLMEDSLSRLQSNISMESIERRRHATADSDIIQPMGSMLGGPDIDMPIMSTQDLIDDNPTSRTTSLKGSPESVDFTRYISGSHHRMSKLSNKSSSLHHLERQTNGLLAVDHYGNHHSDQEQEEPHSGRESIFPTTLTSEPDIDLASEIPMDCLRLQLKMADELNTSMKTIFRHVNEHETSLSVSILNSPMVGRPSLVPRPESPAPNNLSLDFGAHIEDVRALRLKLEETITKNDKLREILEKQLATSKQRGFEVHVQVEERLRTEIQTLTSQLQARTQQMQNVTCELVAKDNQVKSANQKLSELRGALTVEEQNKKKSQRLIQRLEADVSRLSEQLRENSDLNKTLKLELSMYDQISLKQHTKDKPTRGLHGLDIGMLMEEMRELRKQLERTIDNNNMLRDKLEEHLLRSSPEPHLTIHHKYTSDITTVEKSRVHNGNSANGDDRTHNSLLGNHHHGSQQDGNQATSDQVMRYNITDPQRPPGKAPVCLPSSPPTHDDSADSHPLNTTDTGVTSVRVSSDVRCLYAVGAIDDYELLKKQLNEGNAVIHSLRSSLSITKASVQSLDGSTLRRALSCTDNMVRLVKEQLRLVTLFWLTQLPRHDPHSQFVDSDLARENQKLRVQVVALQKKYGHAKEVGIAAADRLNAQNRKNETMEKNFIHSLNKTHAVLRKANENLTQKLHLNPDLH